MQFKMANQDIQICKDSVACRWMNVVKEYKLDKDIVGEDKQYANYSNFMLNQLDAHFKISTFKGMTTKNYLIKDGK